jgi:hypothetical protein
MDTKELLEELRKKLERLQVLEAAFESTAVSTSTRKKRAPKTPEARAKISAAQKKRWAKVRAEKAKAA